MDVRRCVTVKNQGMHYVQFCQHLLVRFRSMSSISIRLTLVAYGSHSVFDKADTYRSETNKLRHFIDSIHSKYWSWHSWVAKMTIYIHPPINIIQSMRKSSKFHFNLNSSELVRRSLAVGLAEIGLRIVSIEIASFQSWGFRIRWRDHSHFYRIGGRYRCHREQRWQEQTRKSIEWISFKRCVNRFQPDQWQMLLFSLWLVVGGVVDGDMARVSRDENGVVSRLEQSDFPQPMAQTKPAVCQSNGTMALVRTGAISKKSKVSLTNVRIDAIVKSTADMFAHAKVYLYGSHLYGIVDDDSDVNIFVDFGKRNPSAKFHAWRLPHFVSFCQRMDTSILIPEHEMSCGIYSSPKHANKQMSGRMWNRIIATITITSSKLFTHQPAPVVRSHSPMVFSSRSPNGCRSSLKFCQWVRFNSFWCNRSVLIPHLVLCSSGSGAIFETVATAIQHISIDVNGFVVLSISMLSAIDRKTAERYSEDTLRGRTSKYQSANQITEADWEWCWGIGHWLLRSIR